MALSLFSADLLDTQAERFQFAVLSPQAIDFTSQTNVVFSQALNLNSLRRFGA